MKVVAKSSSFPSFTARGIVKRTMISASDTHPSAIRAHGRAGSEMFAEARRLSQAVMRNIRQNLFFAFVYNAAGVPIAAGVLYPVLGIVLSPVIAAAAMALSSVSVVGNALRLRRVALERCGRCAILST